MNNKESLIETKTHFWFLLGLQLTFLKDKNVIIPLLLKNTNLRNSGLNKQNFNSKYVLIHKYKRTKLKYSQFKVQK